MVFGGIAEPGAAEHALERVAAPTARSRGGLVATRGPLLCAVVAPARLDPIELAAPARAALAERFGDVRAAVVARRRRWPSCGARSTRRAARSRRRASPTGTRPRSPRTATWAPSS